MTTTIPLAPIYDGPIPSRGDSENFDAEAYLQYKYNSTVTVDLNESFEAMNTASAEVEANASAAESSAELAASSANFVSRWDVATGAATKGSVYFHADQNWQLLDDVADITGTEPSDSNAQWLSILGDLKAAAISLGTSVDNIIYSTDTASAIPAYIFVADGNAAYSAPSDAQGKFIDSVVGSLLTTTDASTYLMKKHTPFNSVKFSELGGVGDAVTDNLQAMLNALQFVADSDYFSVLLIEDEVYYFSDGFDIPEEGVEVLGVASPRMGTFPPPATRTDDTIYLAPGSKNRIPGSIFLFGGVGTTSATTTRTDAFSSGFSYAVRVQGPKSSNLKNIGIIMDMDVWDSFDGSLTSVANDNRSDYDVGLFVDGAGSSHFDDVTVFGYWSLAGTVLYGGEVQTNGADTDYCIFNGGSTSGDIGLAVIGNEDNGLSGTQFNTVQIYSNDHHSRSVVDNQWGTNAVYVDGDLENNDTGINGVFFNNCNIRTSNDNIIALDHCNNVTFEGGVLENPAFGGSTGATLSQFTGTQNTGNVTVNMRMSRDSISDHLRQDMSGVLRWNNEYPTGANFMSLGNSVIRTLIDSNTGDSLIQLANDPSTINSDITLRRDATDGSFDVRLDGVSVFNIDYQGHAKLSASVLATPKKSTLTISGGAVTATSSRHLITAEGGAGADTLTAIASSLPAYTRVLLSTESASDVITLSDSVGNLRLAGDFVMSSVFHMIELEFNGTNFVEISRSSN